MGDSKKAAVRTKLYAAQWRLVLDSIKKWVEYAEENGFKDSIIIGSPVVERLQKKIGNGTCNEYTIDLTSEAIKILYGAIGDYAMYYKESEIDKLLTIAGILEWNHQWKFKKRLDHFTTVVCSKKWKDFRNENI